MAPDLVSQGSSYDFAFQLEGTDIQDFTYTLSAKQYPDDTPAFSRELLISNDGNVYGTVTPAETAAMAIGLWYLLLVSVDPNETIKSRKRIQVARSFT